MGSISRVLAVVCAQHNFLVEKDVTGDGPVFNPADEYARFQRFFLLVDSREGTAP